MECLSIRYYAWLNLCKTFIQLNNQNLACFISELGVYLCKMKKISLLASVLFECTILTKSVQVNYEIFVVIRENVTAFNDYHAIRFPVSNIIFSIRKKNVFSTQHHVRKYLLPTISLSSKLLIFLDLTTY